MRGFFFEMISKYVYILLCLCLVLALFGCGRQNTALTDAEAVAIAEISGVDASGYSDISRDILSRELTKRFPAATKVYLHEHLYAFILKPVAYNGPITLALVIDSNLEETVGLRIVEHNETQHYVRDMESIWFVDRFANKTIHEYLTLVRLHALAQHDIVAITGATVSTQGVINGVNAAFGVYRESVLGQTAEEVSYMVRFEPGQGDGPTETESLAIRTNGVVIAQVSLDDIRALPQVKRTISIHSTAGVSQHSFRGTLLSNILNFVDPGLFDQYQGVLAIGVDEYISDINMDEVIAENNVFVMYEDNDEPLPKKNGEPGSMRIVVINDVFGQRFTNYLLEIVLVYRILNN